MEYEIELYKTETGKCPFVDWLDQEDKRTAGKIQVKLDRLRLGNFGDYKSVGDSLYEIKIDFGPGYRIYFAMVGKKLILLLVVGTKRTQKKDIEKAKTYLDNFKLRRKIYGSH